MVSTFVLIGRCDYFGFGFTTLNRKALTIIDIIAQVGEGGGGVEGARCVTRPNNGCEGDYMTNGPSGGGGTQVY